MVLAANTPLTIIRGEQSEAPVAAGVKIFEGAPLGRNSSGYARGLVAGDRFWGHAMEYVDNSLGGDNERTVQRLTGRYRLEVTLSGVGLTHIGAQVFASADDNYTLTPGNYSAVGTVVRYVGTNTAIVEFDTNIQESGLSALIVISPDGSDTEGDGSWLRPYATLTKAMAVVSIDRKTILVLPGAYIEVGAVAWPTVNGVKLIGLAGQYQTIIGAAAAANEVISVAPGAQSKTWEMWMENIYIDHDESGQDGIKLDNTAMTAKLNCYLKNVGGDGSASDKMITTVHGDTSNAIRIYWDGDNGGVEGNVYFQAKDGGDRLYITGVELNGGLSSSADAVALDIRLTRCIVVHAGVTGGNGAQKVTAISCYCNNAGTFTILATDDLAGSHTEAIVANV